MKTDFTSLLLTMSVVLYAAAILSSVEAAEARLFPAGLPAAKWQEFTAAGYTKPLTGIIYRGDNPRPASGMPIGALATGCLDIETSGLFGYSSIFNHISPRGGPINLPFLGISIGGQTWVLTTGETKQYYMGRYREWGGTGAPPPGGKLDVQGVNLARSIDYWGHYPILDMEYETDAPVSVGLRIWSPFIPGDTGASNTPGAFFEVHLRNSSQAMQSGTLAFSFPDISNHRTKLEPEVMERFVKSIIFSRQKNEWRPYPTTRAVVRRPLRGSILGWMIEDNDWNISYLLGVIDEKSPRLGASLGADGASWRRMAKQLPGAAPNDTGASVAVDFTLEPGQDKVVRYILTWYAPEWNSQGLPELGGSTFTQMYAARYPDTFSVARYLQANRESLLKRIISWQETVYLAPEIPGWFADVLLNHLYYIPENSMWAQAKPPIGYWCRPEDGLFAMNESPRSCPAVETLPNGMVGNVPLLYFFPEADRSGLRAYKAYQWKNTGKVPLLFGWRGEMTAPERGWEAVKNGPLYMERIYRYWLVTGDDDFLKEFYDSAKLVTHYVMNERPEFGTLGLIAMPTPGLDYPYLPYDSIYEEEAVSGYDASVGAMRMAHMLMMRRWAEKANDHEIIRQMDSYLKQASAAFEEQLWNGKEYLSRKDPDTGRSVPGGPGILVNAHYTATKLGLPDFFPADRMKLALDIKPVFRPEQMYRASYHSIYRRAMAEMYAGHTNQGWEVLRAALELFSCKWGYTWEGVNITLPAGGINKWGNNSKEAETPLSQVGIGQRLYGSEYHLNMNIWEVPAAQVGQDLSGPTKPGGLIDRVIRAGRAR